MEVDLCFAAFLLPLLRIALRARHLARDHFSGRGRRGCGDVDGADRGDLAPIAVDRRESLDGVGGLHAVSIPYDSQEVKPLDRQIFFYFSSSTRLTSSEFYGIMERNANFFIYFTRPFQV